MHVINTDFVRPALSLVEKVAGQHVGVVGYGAGPRQVAHSDIKPLSASWRICGPAFTVRSQQCDDRLVVELASKYAKPGDVIVVDAGGRTDVAVWGLSMTRAAARAGVAGVVIDGACMNKALHLAEDPFMPLFVRGVSATTKEALHPGSLNVPAICGSVIVNPGDIVLADADGVVFVPPQFAEKIISGCEQHDAEARSDNKNDISFFQRKNSEEKLRAFPDIEWRTDKD